MKKPITAPPICSFALLPLALRSANEGNSVKLPEGNGVAVKLTRSRERPSGADETATPEAGRSVDHIDRKGAK